MKRVLRCLLVAAAVAAPSLAQLLPIPPPRPPCQDFCTDLSLAQMTCNYQGRHITCWEYWSS